MWTQFMDMHSGGGLKVPPYEYIYIEAPEEKAIEIFEKKFNRNPFNITCSCCGEDYSTNEKLHLDQLTGYERGCLHIGSIESGIYRYIEKGDTIPEGWQLRDQAFRPKYIPLDEYLKQPHIKVVYREDF